MADKKKDIERRYFERFRRLLSTLPQGEPVRTKEPDFLMEIAGKTIGVELVQLDREKLQGATLPHAREAMRRRVVARAQVLYNADKLPPVRCTVFMHNRPIQEEEVESLAVAIRTIAIRNFPRPNASSRENYLWTNRAYFPEIIFSVEVHRLDALTQTHFNCPDTTCFAPLSGRDIHRVLASKEGKYARYRKRCDEAWLLINADIGTMPTWFQFDVAAAAGPVVTKYDRVFVLRHFGNTLHELSIV
jgi:hypothetical protein